MLVVPQHQIQAMPGMMESDACTFDIFPYSVKLARNFKKDLDIAKEKRARYSISNIKLPEMKINDDVFKPLKKMAPVINSASLKFDTQRAKADRAAGFSREDDLDLDQMLSNIR